MKEIDKQTLTYRPQIDYDIVLSQSIFNRIHVDAEVVSEKKEVNEENIKTYKTDILTEFEQYNPASVIQSINELKESKGDLVERIKEMENIAKEAGISLLEQDYEINSPVLTDSYIMMTEVIDEIDQLIEFAERLLEIESSEDDYARFLESEYDRLQNAISQETKEITFYTDYKLTDIERSYVDKLIAENASDIKSYEDYIAKMISDYRDNGAAGIDYAKIQNDTKKSYALMYSMNLTNNMAKMALNSYDFNMESVFNGDVDDALVYLVDIANRSKVKSMSELNYRKTTRDAKVIKDNMNRINNSDFRSRLNDHVLEMSSLATEYMYDIKKDMLSDNEPSILFASLNNSTKSMVDANWDNALVDRMTTSSTLANQLSLLNRTVLEQKQFSLMYRYADLIDREFDFTHKEKEIDVFNSRHDVYSMR